MSAQEWADAREWGDDVDGLVDVDMGGPDDHPDPPEAGGPPQLYYSTLDVFVRDLLAPTYRRPIDARNRSWCPQWWRHAEAIARLEALWRAWEHLRLDPATGVSVWFRDHADHHMTVLLDSDAGPFKYCNTERGHSPRLEPLPVDAPPEGLFQPPAI